jgi:hypothetical protein
MRKSYSKLNIPRSSVSCQNSIYNYSLGITVGQGNDLKERGEL